MPSILESNYDCQNWIFRHLILLLFLKLNVSSTFRTLVNHWDIYRPLVSYMWHRSVPRASCTADSLVRSEAIPQPRNVEISCGLFQTGFRSCDSKKNFGFLVSELGVNLLKIFMWSRFLSNRGVGETSLLYHCNNSVSNYGVKSGGTDSCPKCSYGFATIRIKVDSYLPRHKSARHRVTQYVVCGLKLSIITVSPRSDNPIVFYDFFYLKKLLVH
jgi:hypothetical protein